MTDLLKTAMQLIRKGTPAGLIVDIVNYRTHLALRVYRDNINSFPDYKQQNIYTWLNNTLELINNVGVPCVLEAEATPPNLEAK